MLASPNEFLSLIIEQVMLHKNQGKVINDFMDHVWPIYVSKYLDTQPVKMLEVSCR